MRFENTYALILCMFILIAGCDRAPRFSGDGRLKVVATTTILADLAREIGGEHVEVQSLMGPGIDPHLYQASAGDVAIMKRAVAVIYNGLNLEGGMGKVLDGIGKRGGRVICIADGIDGSRLIKAEGGHFDPHIWFDPALWKGAAAFLAESLCNIDGENAEGYRKNAEEYCKKLDELDMWIRERISQIPENERILVTAHDAFSYFGRAYGFRVLGLLGINTNAEASAADISALAGVIAENRIRAVFAESTISPKTIEALLAAVEHKGFNCKMGGRLYSDSLGDIKSNTETYLKTFRANVDTIVEGLTWEELS